MGQDYFKNYYQKNKEKIKQQSKNNYNKKKRKIVTIPVEFKKGQFIISFD
tara:strand:- start:2 stop:151 length:150 start_codon:yes stop_codon:yes gene_type:complete